MKQTWIGRIALLLGICLVVLGCGKDDTQITKSDEENINKAAKEMPSNPPGQLPGGTKGSFPSDP